MTQILKRLEIIKSSISIEELEIIELQITKLQTLGIDEDVRIIIQNLEDGAYATAETLIQNYLAKFSGVAIYDDSELSSLKLELKSLESKLQNLIEQKTEYLSDIEEFNNEYNLHLGELIKAILSLKKEMLYKKIIKQHKQKAKYQENLQTFEETKETIEEIKNTIAELEEALESIGEDEELTKAHKELQEEIEVLEKELKNQEEELEKAKEFIEDETIEEEYEEAKANFDEYENEYKQTKEILHSFQNSTNFEVSSETIEDKELLKAKIKEYLKNIEAIKSEIEAIKEDDAYKTISGLDDWDGYFEELKSELEIQKEEIEEKARGILKEREEEKKQEDRVKELELKMEENLLQPENTPYSKYIQSIDVPNFEKIRRYCNNLVDENKADEMQKYLAENGKMHKALIYDALEQFISQLNGKNLTLVEWGCEQGIASMLVLDYIREKQLDIEVVNVILIEDDTKALSRAMAHNQVFVSQSVEISGFGSKDKTLSTKLKNTKGSNFLHIFANDTMPMKFKDVGFESIPNSYFMCISSVNSVFLEKVYSEISALSNTKTLSSRDGQIGRFKRFERIFKTN